MEERAGEPSDARSDPIPGAGLIFRAVSGSPGFNIIACIIEIGYLRLEEGRRLLFSWTTPGRRIEIHRTEEVDRFLKEDLCTPLS